MAHLLLIFHPSRDSQLTCENLNTIPNSLVKIPILGHAIFSSAVDQSPFNFSTDYLYFQLYTLHSEKIVDTR